jgi:hypothetical protein
MVGDGEADPMNKIARSSRKKGVLSVQLEREGAWQPSGASNGRALKRLCLSVCDSETTPLHGQSASNQRVLERLEVENAQLRGNVVELALQIQALRDGVRTLTV